MSDSFEKLSEGDMRDARARWAREFPHVHELEVRLGNAEADAESYRLRIRELEREVIRVAGWWPFMVLAGAIVGGITAAVLLAWVYP